VVLGVHIILAAAVQVVLEQVQVFLFLAHTQLLLAQAAQALLMQLAALGVILQLAHPLLLHRLAVVVVLAVTAVRLRLGVLAAEVHQVQRLGLVTLLQLQQAKVIMVEAHLVLLARVAVALVPLDKIINLQLVVQAVLV